MQILNSFFFFALLKRGKISNSIKPSNFKTKKTPSRSGEREAMDLVETDLSCEPRARQSQGLDETLLYQPHTLSRSGEREVIDLVETDLCCENLVLANTRAS